MNIQLQVLRGCLLAKSDHRGGSTRTGHLLSDYHEISPYKGFVTWSRLKGHFVLFRQRGYVCWQGIVHDHREETPSQDISLITLAHCIKVSLFWSRLNGHFVLFRQRGNVCWQGVVYDHREGDAQPGHLPEAGL